MAHFEMHERYDIVVVGAGLAGLTAATLLARAGRSVIVFERAPELGGRARTRASGGFHFNLGPHALYRGGEALPMLRELGVAVHGHVVPVSAAKAVLDGYLISLGAALFSSRLLRPGEKIEAARFFARLGKVDTSAIQRLSLQSWAEQQIRSAAVRRLFYALVRVSTYGNDIEHQSAGAAVAQLQRATAESVLYLDGGWQSLVDGLATVARTAGVRIEAGARVAAVESTAAHCVRLADGRRIVAGAVLLAIGPSETAALVEHAGTTSLAAWAAQARPIHLATLDLGLDHLPQPRNRVAIGLDRPLYLSVHSAFARLAPQGGATIHVAKYLDPYAPDTSASVELELEGLLDLAQPGWREHIVERRFLPHLLVSNALVMAENGGRVARPGPRVPGMPNLYVAGDWVGAQGMLADAAMASARTAAEMILQSSPIMHEEPILDAVA